MSKEINIFWFRRDLRLYDNKGFYEALTSNKTVLPIFIFDPTILDELPKDDARLNFIHDQITEMNTQLKRDYNSGIAQFYNTPLETFKQLTKEFTITTVYTNNDYEPYALKRDKEVADFLTSVGVTFKSFKDQVIFEKNEITKADGLPYRVYTPYMRQWKKEFTANKPKDFPCENLFDNLYISDKIPTQSLSDLGFTKTNTPVPDYKLSRQLIQTYEETRNFPAKDSTSKIGPHLRFGTVSVRDIALRASKEDNEIYLQELIWREFFMQILWHFPNTPNNAFKPKYDHIKWRNNETEFKKWCEGKTGYPLVDAGMRELNQTGFMHNRVRMLVGSFLCKHLLIDWRWGEAYFALKLHDYDMSSNVGNWQWVAGSGVDASPYFRIFNPTTQIDKFDKQHLYIKKWVPEYQELTYTKPIVDHKEARERCLKVYKEAVA